LGCSLPFCRQSLCDIPNTHLPQQYVPPKQQSPVPSDTDGRQLWACGSCLDLCCNSFQFLSTNRTSLIYCPVGRAASQNRTCVCLNSRVVFDWPVCYSSPGSHQCDSSVAILRGGGDHENLAGEPWLQIHKLSRKIGSVSYGKLYNRVWTLVMPSQKTIFSLGLRVRS
jgi:hypothetical protein